MFSEVILSAESHAILHGASPLLLTSVIIIIGSVGGELAHKVKLPALTGQILVGILIGASCLNLLGHTEEDSLKSLTSFAIGLIAVTVGAHLNFKLLHNSLKRILYIAIAESLTAFACVFFALQYFNPFNFAGDVQLPLHLLIASLACATSPASSLHVIKEKNAKGILVKTMVAVIAIDNLICLAVFAIVRAIAKLQIGDGGLFMTIAPSVSSFILATSIGILAGFTLHSYSKFMHKKYVNQSRSVLNSLLFTVMLIAIMMCHGLCEYMKYLWEDSSFKIMPSPLMANMVMGIVLANKSNYKDHFLEQFEVLEKAIFTCFFTLAGMHLDLGAINQSVLIASGIYLGGMATGKYIGAFCGAYLGSATRNISKYIGRTLIVQAGLTIALLFVINEDDTFNEYSNQIMASILTCVVATELFGTVLISKTLDVAKESNRNQTRLIDFLQEEFILSSMYVHDKWEAIEELCHFMVKTHNLTITPEELQTCVVARENEMPTGIGEGIAVPHAKMERSVPGINKIMGVLALADPKVDFDAPDGEPARLIILIITPENHHDRHLEVIGAIARMMQHEDIRNDIFNAKSAAEIHEIIHSEEADSFNYILHS